MPKHKIKVAIAAASAAAVVVVVVTVVSVQCTVDLSEASPAFSGAPCNSDAVSVSAQPGRANRNTDSPALMVTE